MAESPNAAISTTAALIITPPDGATATSTGANAGVAPNRLERRTVWPTTSPTTGTTRPSVAHHAWGCGAEADNHLRLEPGLARPGTRPWPPTSRERRISSSLDQEDQRGYGFDPGMDRVFGKT